MASLTTPRVFAIFTIVALAGLTTTMAAFGAYSNSKSIQSSGAVMTVNVGVYWNSACSNATTTINWGSITPGTTKFYTVYVRNEGSSSETLSLSTQGWNPSNANTYITLSWNAPTSTVAVNSVTTVTLTLTVSSSITGITSFSFTTIVTGTG